MTTIRVAERLVEVWGDGSVGKEVALQTQGPLSPQKSYKETWVVYTFTVGRREAETGRSLDFTGLTAWPLGNLGPKWENPDGNA